MIPKGDTENDIMFLVETFRDWLQDQINQQGWTLSDFARRSGIKPSSLSRVLDGSRNAGTELCSKIAKALDLPEDFVFRKAGLLREKQSGPNEEIEEIMAILESLTPEEREDVLKYVEFLRHRRGRATLKDKETSIA